MKPSRPAIVSRSSGLGFILAATLVGLTLTPGACSLADPAIEGQEVYSTDNPPSDVEEDFASAASDAIDNNPSGDTRLGANLETLDCDDYGFETDEEVTFVAVYRVVDATLGDLCFGQPNPATETAWSVLADITPPGQLLDLGLFAGFEALASEESQTLAFVNALDDDGVLYQMSVNAEVAEQEPETLTITLAHELSHVFTALPFELDRAIEYDECDTFYSGEGCYTPESLMASWITDFWNDGLIDEIDLSLSASELEDAGYERCQYEPGFFGAYAASSPEEDFAEAFGAYVLRVPAATDQQQQKLDWIAARPGLRKFQEQASAADYGPDANTFDSCGDLVPG